MKCNRCWKENVDPVYPHTCTAPLAIALVERLDVPPGAPLFVDAAAELRRLHAENDALRGAINKFVSEELMFGQRYTNAGQGLLDALARAGDVK
jgi:hypothetical protein